MCHAKELCHGRVTDAMSRRRGPRARYTTAEESYTTAEESCQLRGAAHCYRGRPACCAGPCDWAR